MTETHKLRRSAGKLERTVSYIQNNVFFENCQFSIATPKNDFSSDKMVEIHNLGPILNELLLFVGYRTEPHTELHTEFTSQQRH